jgi:hypothetical protein
LGKGTVEKEMAESLNRGASMTEEGFGSERKDTRAKRQGVQDQLVPRFPMTRKERGAPKPTPDIRRRDSQAGDGTRIPVQDRGNAVQPINETTGLDRGKLRNGGITNQEVGVQVGNGGGVRKGKRERAKEMDELCFERGWGSTNTLKDFDDAFGSLTAETRLGISIRYKHRVSTRVVIHEQGNQRNTDLVPSGVSAGRDIG